MQLLESKVAEKERENAQLRAEKTEAVEKVTKQAEEIKKLHFELGEVSSLEE